MSVLNNRRVSKERQDQTEKRTQQLQNSAQQSKEKAVIRPDYHARQPRVKLECSLRDERLDGEFAVLETGFDVCREGWVSFSHPTNQPTKKKKKLQGQYETF